MRFDPFAGDLVGVFWLGSEALDRRDSRARRRKSQRLKNGGLSKLKQVCSESGN